MYARVVTSQVLPHKLEEMTVLYQESLLPILKKQPGFKSILVLTNPDTNKEVSITMWASEAAMDAFNDKLLPLADQFIHLLHHAPDVELFEVNLPLQEETDYKPVFSESSLGVRVEESFVEESSLLPA